MEAFGVIGQGFVGATVRQFFNTHVPCWTLDIKKGNHFWAVGGQSVEIPDLDYCRLIAEVDGPIFVCLPTPMDADGSCNLSIVDHVLMSLNAAAYATQRFPNVAIKSTMPPGSTKHFAEEYACLSLCHVPEFLRECSPLEDMNRQKWALVGGDDKAAIVLQLLYAIKDPEVDVYKTTSDVTEMAKYIVNCFLSVKVSFANEMNRICEAIGIDYDEVVTLAKMDERLGKTHWEVPGPDGHRGFGGSCFPKDVNAMLKFAESVGVTPWTLDGAWVTNLLVRPEKDWCQLKGRAVVED